MDKDICSSCSKRDNCPVEPGEKHYYFRYTDRDLRISERRIYEESDEFRDKYRYRAGSEATMSEFDRRTGGKSLRVRGLDRKSVV